MRRIGVVPICEKAQAILSKYDQNKDGRLSYQEFLIYMMDREKKWKIDFHALDMNKSGTIDLEDIMTLFKGLGLLISKHNAKKIIQMMDEDNSMTVDWEEFLQHIIINPAENISELVSSWKHNLVFDVGESRSMPVELTPGETDPSVWAKFILASGLADAVSRTATAPIDRLKTRLQMRMYSLGERDSLSVHQRFGLGCVSGAVAHAVFYPLEVLKVRLNLQTAGTYNGVLGCAKLIYQNESVAAFYRGFKPSILCMIPYAGVECAVHQSILNWARQDPGHISDPKLFLISFAAFASGQATSYPLAVIRTQQQAQAVSATSQKPVNVLQGLIGIYEAYGVRGFYNGMGASFVRAVPCALLNYTMTSKFETLLSSL
ncbi:Calcium-binding mitochondrial carrier protein SCaMC-3 [Triplophysa tibetana]|uniref:Calcium-binding mitochondrial carrier protein SCaMC-3 n=1 Tax=Triplophysa tibetana TaxID=1572043 RepID=A0A5A9PE44_9TELE|nr:Calcium-binding mitochondrial carrier protein SCaMC-3 [Triplophysa tibetana]